MALHDVMYDLALLTLAVLSAQLLLGRLYQSLGAGLARSSTTKTRRARAAATLRRPGRVALAGLSIAAGVLIARGAGPFVHGLDGLRLAALVALGAPATAGCYLLLTAARLESHGRLRPARGLARTAGRSAFAGAMLVTLAMALVLAAGHATAEAAPDRGRLVVAAAGALAVSGGGGVALLAGLSGKPRPACYVATPLLIAGLAAWVAATTVG